MPLRLVKTHFYEWNNEDEEIQAVDSNTKKRLKCLLQYLLGTLTAAAIILAPSLCGQRQNEQQQAHDPSKAINMSCVHCRTGVFADLPSVD